MNEKKLLTIQINLVFDIFNSQSKIINSFFEHINTQKEQVNSPFEHIN